jgi:hypothetical protein
MSSLKKDAWLLDQLTKSIFFHQKLHEWGMLEVTDAIESVQGERLDWNLGELNISQSAWDRVIHRGIKPITVFAHPEILTRISRSLSYYRMLSMVSQKSMGQIGLSSTRYEQGASLPDLNKAHVLARRLNGIISNLIESDETLDVREFSLWRGMAAGSQAQGSWQNTKGDRAEIVIKGMLKLRFQEKHLLVAENDLDDEEDTNRYAQIMLADGRLIVFGDEPDIAFLQDHKIRVAVEVKGGIDIAGVLERIGAAIKSLRRAKDENPNAVTILIVQGVSVSEQARKDLKSNQEAVNQWFTVEEILDDEQRRETFFGLLKI